MITFTYNGISCRTYSIVAKSVNRPMLPVLRKRELAVPGRHGVYDFSDNTFEKRIIEVELKYVGTSFAELRTRARQIASWLSGFSGAKNLVFSDEPDKWYVAKIYSEIGLRNLFKLGQTTIQFECEPFAYATLGEYDEAYNYGAGQQYDDGLIYPNNSATFTWLFNPQMTSLYNHATIKTPFKITIYGQVENPRVYQETISAEFTISANMTAGSTMIIDSETLTVKLNGSNYLHKMTGDFLNLEIGANGFFFYGTNPNSEVTFDFKHRWL